MGHGEQGVSPRQVEDGGEEEPNCIRKKGRADEEDFHREEIDGKQIDAEEIDCEEVVRSQVDAEKINEEIFEEELVEEAISLTRNAHAACCL